MVRMRSHGSTVVPAERCCTFACVQLAAENHPSMYSYAQETETFDGPFVKNAGQQTGGQALSSALAESRADQRSAVLH